MAIYCSVLHPTPIIFAGTWALAVTTLALEKNQVVFTDGSFDPISSCAML